MSIAKGHNVRVRSGDSGWWTVDKVEGERIYLSRNTNGLRQTMVMALSRVEAKVAEKVE